MERDPNVVVNFHEAAQLLRIKPRTLYPLVARGIVPGTKIGRQWRFRISGLNGLFDTQRRETGTSVRSTGAKLSPRHTSCP